MQKVSIIIPVYNTRKDFLETCIESIINQSYKNLEIIIIDDGSKKETAEILDKYLDRDSRIKVIHKENGGVSEARNLGIFISTGEWIAFVDSDDWLEIDAIKNLVIHANECDVVIGRYFIDDEKQITINNSIQTVLNENNMLINNLFLDKPNIKTLGSACGKLYSRSIIINNKIQFSKEIKMGEDYLFNFDFFVCTNKAKYIPEYIFHYRNNNDSVTRKYDDRLVEKYNLLLGEFEERITTINNINIKKAYEVFVIRQIDYFFFIGIYQFDNINKNERIKILKDVSNARIYKKAIKNVKLKLLSRGKQVLIILLRLKLYRVLDLFLIKKRRYVCRKN